MEASQQAKSIKSEPPSPEVNEFSHSSDHNDGVGPSKVTMANLHDLSAPSSPSQASHHSGEAIFDDVSQEEMVELDASTEEIQSGYTSPCHDLSHDANAAFDFAQTTSDAFASLAATQSPVMACQVTAEMVMSTASATCSMPVVMEDISSTGFGAFSLDMITAFSDAELKHPIPALAPQTDQDIPQPSVESNYSRVSPVPMTQSPPMMHVQDFRIKSPPVVGLAGRRRRPAPAPLGIRNAAHGPTTSMSFAARTMDPGSPMRRVASATGFAPQGVRKTAMPQRSPFPERNPENFVRLFHTQTPTIHTGVSIMAPPTPDTPVVPQQAAREATVSSCSSEEDQSMLYRQSSMSSLGSAMDQSLRTPPATPSNMPDMYPFSNIAFTVHDDPVLTPSLGDTFSDIGAPPYATSGCGSQPPTPSFAPAGAMGFQTAFADGTQYCWPAAQSGSAASSPNARVRQLQFNNMTAEHFHSRK